MRFPLRLPRRSPRLPVAVASLAAALLVGEGILRARLDTHAYRIWPPGLETVFRPAPGLMAGVEGESAFRVNSRGFRGEEPDPGATYRILALGGSTTECLYLDQAEAWPALVETLLDRDAAPPRVQVENGGVSGRTTRDHVVQLRHLLPQHPEFDAVLLMTGVNDLALRLGQGDAYDPEALRRPGAEERLLPRAFARLPLAVDTGAPWYRRTGWWRLASLVRARLAGPDRVQDEAGSVYALWREHRRRAGRWIDEPPDLETALEEHARLLGTIAELCADAGVRLVLLTHPAVWAPDLPAAVTQRLWMGGVGDYQNETGATYYTPRALAAGLAAFQDTMRRTAAARGVECLDLAAVLAGDPGLFYDDVHLNERGARRAAEAVAAWLAARPPFR